jgi:acetyl esterase/lipase
MSRIRLLITAVIVCCTVHNQMAAQAVQQQQGQQQRSQREQAAQDHIIPDVVYGHKAGMALTFDVFKPAVNANGAGILVMVSGGWVSSWRDPALARVAHASMLDAGFTVFAVRHGSSPQFKVPEAYADVKRALRYITLNASDWGVDPNRLGATGGSAGGHLSLMLGNTADNGDPDARDPVLRGTARLAAVVAYFPPVDLRGITGPSERFPALDFSSDLAESVSPILFVTPDDPPTLLIHGTADQLVPDSQSRIMHAAFRERGVATELILIEGAAHGFQGAAAEQANEARIKWFLEHLLKRN